MDIFNEYSWHSCIEPEKGISGSRKITRIAADSAAAKGFRRVSRDGSFLIHTSTKALWKFSEDGKTIEPVFKDDFLTEEEIEEG